MNILVLLWTFLPVGLANMAPVLANNIPVLRSLTQPLDFNKKFHGKRILGNHKTFRGLFAAVLMGFLVGLMQFLIYKIFEWPSASSAPINYDSLTVAFIGAFLGLGAIVGDAVKSFFKRQVGIKPGHNWLVFDQIDYVLGGILFSMLLFQLPLGDYLIVIGLGLILHPIINVVSWVLKLQDKPL